MTLIDELEEFYKARLEGPIYRDDSEVRREIVTILVLIDIAQTLRGIAENQA